VSRLPLGDLSGLAGPVRRTLRSRLVLAAALVGLGAAALVLSLPGGRSRLLPSSGNTVVVIDLSGSTRPASKRIARALLGLTRGGQRNLGLVVFSDTGYEALPIGAPASGLRDWLTLLAHGTPQAYPWTPSFSGGTVISSGLAIARRMLRSTPPGERHVLLVSDLVDGIVDLPKLQSVVARYQRERIDLRVITVREKAPAGTPAAASFLQLPNSAFVADAAQVATDSTRIGTTDRGPAVALAAIVAALAALAAVHELLLTPLTWRRT